MKKIKSIFVFLFISFHVIAQNVGISTSNPLTKLHILGGAGNTGYGDVAIGNASNSLRLGIFSTGILAGKAFINAEGSGVRQLQIGSGLAYMNFNGVNQRIGVGTFSPSSFFHIARPQNIDVRVESTTGDADLIIESKAGVSAIEFESNNSFKGSFGYDTGQDRMFLYAGGNVLFAKDGELSLPHLANASNPSLHVNASGQLVTEEDVLETWSFGSVDFFNTRLSTATVLMSEGGLVSATENHTIFAPVKIPNGANLKSMIVYFRDEIGNGTIELEFKRCNLKSNGCDVIGNFSSLGLASLGGVLVSDPIDLNHVVDTNQYSYFISAKVVGGFWTYQLPLGGAFVKGIQSVVISEDPDLQ